MQINAGQSTQTWPRFSQNRISGERTRFTYWDSGESHGNFEDCAMLEMDRGGHWGDVSCTGFLFSTEKHGYICEYNLV